MRELYTGDEYFSQIEKKLEKELDKKRFIHTKGVAYTAVSLAMAHGESLHDAYLAGLLHDCAKCIPAEDKLTLCRKYKLTLSEAEQANPDLLHAKLGAVIAKEKYDIQNDDILNAICYHTTGKPDMTELEKIIYIADYMEPNRKMLDGLKEVRQMAFRDLNQAMVMISHHILQYLQEKQVFIDPLTKETYDYYKEMTGKE